MSILILGSTADAADWAQTAMAMAAAADVPARFQLVGRDGENSIAGFPVLDVDAADARLAVIGAIVPGTTIVLASSKVPLALIDAVFATPDGQASRKIVDIADVEPDDAAVRSLFDIADMLIFTPEAFAATLGLEALPQDVESLLPVQPWQVRYNQGVVVRLPGTGGVAVWADRTMLVPETEPAMPGASRARFSGTIAAAVARKIGPEPAMTMALAAMSGATRPN
jgi:hypothetical protein